MQRFGLWAVTGLLAAVVQAAPVYECVDAHGNRSYGEYKGTHCRAADLKGIGFSTAPAYRAPVSPAMGAAGVVGDALALEAGNASDTERDRQLAQARRAVQAARRNLEEGRKVRYGNERNYARYLERIAGLEKAVAESEAQLKALLAQP